MCERSGQPAAGRGHTETMKTSSFRNHPTRSQLQNYIMNNMLNQLLATPLSIIILASVMVVLMALTMYSVIKRDRAMTRARRNNSEAKESYMSRWQNRTGT